MCPIIGSKVADRGCLNLQMGLGQQGHEFWEGFSDDRDRSRGKSCFEAHALAMAGMPQSDWDQQTFADPVQRGAENNRMPRNFALFMITLYFYHKGGALSTSLLRFTDI